MGLLSTLALLTLPLMRRETPPEPQPAAPNESLIAILNQERGDLKAEVKRLRKELLEALDLVDAWRRRAEAANTRRIESETQWLQQAPALHIDEALRQQMMAHAQCQQQAQAMAAQAFYPYQQAAGLAQAPMVQNWHVCNCTPPHGRAGFLLGDGS